MVRGNQMTQVDFAHKNIRVKMLETADELYQTRRLRYEELILFHRDRAEISFEQSYNDDDLYCDHLIAIDTDTSEVVGSYRLITRKHLKTINKFACENNFNIDDIKKQSYNVMELGRAVVKNGYRDGLVIKMLLSGVLKYVTQNDIRLMFGSIFFPPMEKEAFDKLLSYFNMSVSKDSSLQPYAYEPYLTLNRTPIEALNLNEVKRTVPPILKAYISMGCVFAKSAHLEDKVFDAPNILIMLDFTTMNKKFVELMTRL